MFDSHAHLTSEELLPHAEAIIERALSAGVEKIVNICTDKTSLLEGLALRKKHPQIFNTAATTPHDVDVDGEQFFPIVQEHIKELVAIGETGLDYHYVHSPKEIQQAFLSRYFALAKEASLPVIFHCRDAFEDLFAMSDEQMGHHRGLLHCFTGTKQEAKGCLERGWMISFSGILTFKRSEELREVAQYVPLDHIVIETDSPYLAPQTKRGKQNEPAFIGETAETLARVKNVSVDEIVAQTNLNASKFFALN